MFVKTKKITLSKILISSSLLLSTIGLPLALTCCSKKNDLVRPLDQPHHTGYLFKSQPKFFNDKGEDVSANLILEADVKKLLDIKKGYNEKFFEQLDSSFGNHTFEEESVVNEKIDYKDITPSLGDVDVYYLNVDDVEKKINFDINDQMLDKCDSIDDVKKYISFSFFKKKKVSDTSGNNTQVTKLLLQKPEPDEKLLAFYGKGSNDKKDEKIIVDKDVAKIKKATIDFSSSEFTSLKDDGLCGLLVTLKSFDENSNSKTIVIKFVKNNEEFQYFDLKSYENFDKEIKEVANDYFINITTIDNKNFNDFISEKLNNDKKPIEIKKGEIAIKNEKDVDKWVFNVNSFFEENGNLKLSTLEKYLANEFSLTLDIDKTKKYKTLSFVNSLPQKIDDKDYKCLVCIGKNIDANKYNDIVVENNNKEVTKKSTTGTYDIEFSNSNEEKNAVGKITIKKLDIDFISKDIEIEFKS